MLQLIAGIAGLIFALMGAALVVVCLAHFRLWFDVRGTDWQDVVGIDRGFAKVTGTATPRDETVTAPFTGRECLAVESAIMRRSSAGSGGPRWQDDHTTQESVPFEVGDPTGSVAIDPSEADWSVTSDHEHTIESGEAPSGPYAQYVEDEEIYFFDDAGVSEAQRLRFVERRIEPGDELHVFGPVEAGVETWFRPVERWFVDPPFSLAEQRSDLTGSVTSGLMTGFVGLAFLSMGLTFAWLGLF